jgi:hypothetical protein
LPCAPSREIDGLTRPVFGLAACFGHWRLHRRISSSGGRRTHRAASDSRVRLSDRLGRLRGIPKGRESDVFLVAATEQRSVNSRIALRGRGVRVARSSRVAKAFLPHGSRRGFAAEPVHAHAPRLANRIPISFIAHAERDGRSGAREDEDRNTRGGSTAQPPTLVRVALAPATHGGVVAQAAVTPAAVDRVGRRELASPPEKSSESRSSSPLVHASVH